jgi:hypothetical protein
MLCVGQGTGARATGDEFMEPKGAVARKSLETGGLDTNSVVE